MPEIKYLAAENKSVPSEEEAEARLHKEGYNSFRWYDVPGAEYPKHRHVNDECIWVLKGEITFTVDGKDFELKPGDRLYLPAKAAHTAKVPLSGGVTYLVGQKR
jgi:quercetin dioxygenase-like cupin family protein